METNEAASRRRKVIALVAGIDLMVRDMSADLQTHLDKHEVWVAAERFAGLLSEGNWENLAHKLEINPPSGVTIQAVREALAQRVVIVRRWDRLNHGNNVQAGA